MNSVENIFFNPLNHPIIFTQPYRLVEPPSWVEHIPFIMFLVEIKRPGLLVELGTHTGNSYCAMCQAIQYHQLDTRAFAVDTWAGDPHAGLYDEEVLDDLREYHGPLYGEFSQLLQSTFDDALDYFSSGSIDLLHIDGYHTYDAVKHDFETWLPKISSDGLIVFHDINMRQNRFGAWQLWEEIRDHLPSFEFLHGHGLGVLALSDNQPELLRRLLQLSPQQTTAVRVLFGALGNRLTSQLQRQSHAGRDEDVAQTLNYVQLFLPTAAGYREDASLRQPLSEEKWQRLTFEINPMEVNGALRLDPLERPGVVEIARVTVRSSVDRSVLWRTRGDAIAEDVTVLGTALVMSSQGRLRLFCYGNDAQIVLPQLPRSGPLIVEIWAKLYSNQVLVTEEIAELNKNVVSLKQALDTREAQIEQLESDKALAAKELTGLNQYVVSLKQTLAARELQIEQLETECTKQADQYKMATNTLADHQARAERLTAELAARTGDLNATQVALFGKEVRIGRLEHSLQNCEAQLAGIQKAYSWRVTRPLRRARRSRLGRWGKAAYWWITGQRRYRQAIKKEAKYLKASGLFDADFYREQYPDVTAVDISPEEHFVRFGVSQQRNPNPLFDTAYYLCQNPALDAAEVNPLRHYLEQGADSMCNPHPLFDNAFYLAQHPDTAEHNCSPLLHFLRHGVQEGLDPSPLFSTSFYLEQNPDVAAAGINPLVHFIQHGAAERRDPHPKFDITFYLEQNPDVAAAGVNPLVHFIQCGAAEGRISSSIASTDFDYIVPQALEKYDAWLTVNKLTQKAKIVIEAALAEFKEKLPKISVIMPVYNTPPELLGRAIDSVVQQIYTRWELCIVDDASSLPEVKNFLEKCSTRDARIKLLFSQKNKGISKATNLAASLATGDVVAFLDHDDELTPDALAEIALYYAKQPEADIVYSDDDKIDLEGNRFDPQFKPDWSPALLLSYAYTSHLLTVRRTLFETVGGFRTGFEGAQDYDFVLNASEQARHIGHIPKILYHWRVAPGSTAVAGDAKKGSIEAGRLAVSEAFQRRGHKAEISQPEWAKNGKLGVFCPIFPDNGPSVTIIIPTKNAIGLLQRCLASLEQTRYQNYNLLIVDNESDDPEAMRCFRQLKHQVAQIKNPNGRFSFAHVMNQAALVADGEYLLFLNNDTEVVSPEWLSQMIGYAQMDGVGTVGARLMFPNGKIQHAGVVHGYSHGLLGHAFKNNTVWSGYLSYLLVAREYSAITGACMLTPKRLFLEAGGFDEENFAVAYNDVDYCYRLVDRGYRCIYVPVELLHHENASRGSVDNPKEEAAVRYKYGGRVDPWYNPNLSLADEGFQIRPYRDASWVKNPVRAVLFSHNLNREGAPCSLLELASGLTRQGFVEPTVISPVDGPLRTDFEAAGIDIQIVPGPDVKQPHKFRDEVYHAADVIQQTGAEVVYANTAQNFWVIHAAHIAGLPSLWNIRESEPWEDYFDFVALELRDHAYDCFIWPYRVIFVADRTRQVWMPLNSRQNFVVIPNGLNLEQLGQQAELWTRNAARQQLGITADELAVVLVGTICDRKGQLDLVQAIHNLEKNVSARLRCFLVGDCPSPYSERLKAYVDGLPSAIESRITIVPVTDDVALYYQAADIAVCTSRLESYPRVTLEAMAYGLPQIATPVFGIVEQLREGVNCLFYPPGDAHKLADALTRLVSDNQLRARLANNAQPSLAAHISYEEMVGQYGSLFCEASLTKQ